MLPLILQMFATCVVLIPEIQTSLIKRLGISGFYLRSPANTNSFNCLGQWLYNSNET